MEAERTEACYATYMTRPEELAMARVLFESIRVFDKSTPFYFVAFSTQDMPLRLLEDFYPVNSYYVAQVPWPDTGVPYRSVWQLPHTLTKARLCMHLPFNTIINSDLSWLFSLFPKYAERLGASVGFGVSQDKEMLPLAFLADFTMEKTWRFFEAVRDFKVTHWSDAAFYLSRSWNEVMQPLEHELSPAMPLMPLCLHAVDATHVSGRVPHVLIDGLPCNRNLLILPTRSRIA